MPPGGHGGNRLSKFSKCIQRKHLFVEPDLWIRNARGYGTFLVQTFFLISSLTNDLHQESESLLTCGTKRMSFRDEATAGIDHKLASICVVPSVNQFSSFTCRNGTFNFLKSNLSVGVHPREVTWPHWCCTTRSSGRFSKAELAVIKFRYKNFGNCIKII